MTPPPLTDNRRTRWQAHLFKARTWVVDHVPVALLTHAHEVALAIALGLVAFPFVLGATPGPESVHSQAPFIIARFWAWTLLVSSVLTLGGLFWHRPRMEWAGQLFMGYGLTFYAAAITWGAGWNGLLASVIFGVLGAISWWSAFKITHAPLIQHRLVREARSAHERAHIKKMKDRRRKGSPS